MNHEIYIFGSMTRGEIFSDSDADVLVVANDAEAGRYPAAWSVYSQQTLERYFDNGKLFAWHLYLDAKCIYTDEPVPLLERLGQPSPYKDALSDIAVFETLLLKAVNELSSGTTSSIFELGLIYTCLRDIAMSASWQLLPRPTFSRYAPYRISLEVPLGIHVYESLVQARCWSMRGIPCKFDLQMVVNELQRAKLHEWIQSLKAFL